MERASALDELIEQVLVIGEGRPYLSVLMVPNDDAWKRFCGELGMSPEKAFGDERMERALLERIQFQLRDFPGYAQIRRVAVMREPWGIENGLMTPTMKLRRGRILETCGSRVRSLYEGH